MQNRRKTIQNIKKVSLIFFVVTGILHLGSSVFRANELFIDQARLINRIMDIPFIITGLIYGLTSLRMALTDPAKEHKTLDIIGICAIILALVGLIVVNILIPDIST